MGAAMMTDQEIAGRGLAFEAGYWDAYGQQGRGRWVLLHLSPPSDREVSDYWYGWHQGLRELRLQAEKTRRVN
jgi:hypothetical protein